MYEDFLKKGLKGKTRGGIKAALITLLKTF